MHLATSAQLGVQRRPTTAIIPRDGECARSATAPAQLRFVRILHDRVPGRVRLAILGLRGAPAFADLLQQALGSAPEVREAKACAVTGNMLVLYDRQAPRSLIIGLAERAAAAFVSRGRTRSAPPARRAAEGPLRRAGAALMTRISGVVRRVLAFAEAASDALSTIMAVLGVFGFGRGRAGCGAKLLGLFARRPPGFLARGSSLFSGDVGRAAWITLELAAVASPGLRAALDFASSDVAAWVWAGLAGSGASAPGA